MKIASIAEVKANLSAYVKTSEKELSSLRGMGNRSQSYYLWRMTRSWNG